VRRVHRHGCTACQVILYEMGSGSTQAALVKYSSYGRSKASQTNQLEVRRLGLLGRVLFGAASVRGMLKHTVRPSLLTPAAAAPTHTPQH
jgi:hypothetical protein